MKQDDEDEGNLLSFLDVIACAFGAVVLLVLMIPIGQPEARPEQPEADSDYQEFRSRSAQIDALRLEQATAQRAVNQAGERLAMATSLADESSASQPLTEAELVKLESQVVRLVAENLAVDAQIKSYPASTPEISETPSNRSDQRLANERYGIPADADHVVFVIDASGSMQAIASSVARTLTRVLDLYPKLQGFQVLDDQGAPLFSASEGRWLNDSPSVRSRVVSAIRGWRPYSNSSPVEGIETAVRRYLKPGSPTAIFVFGDDHSQGDFESFLEKIADSIPTSAVRGGFVRIHAVGFANEPRSTHPEQFGLLMRELAQRYNGAYLFVPTEAPSALRLEYGNRQVQAD
jgi:hypothetical protein